MEDSFSTAGKVVDSSYRILDFYITSYKHRDLMRVIFFFVSQPISFPDFFLADILTSMVKV